jgi:ParB/RepB/Spo0J family partition protein
MAKTAFNAARGSYFKFSPTDLVIIGLDTDDGPEHELWDARINEPEDSESLQAMAKDVAVRGVLQPVIIRKDGDKAQVVAGRRRVRAARIANSTILNGSNSLVKVPAIRRQGDALDMVAVLVSENEHRDADAFLDRAKKAAKMRALGSSMGDAAVAFGVQTAAVRRWLRVLELDEEIIGAIRDGRIAPYAAMELSTLPREQQLEAFRMAMSDVQAEQQAQATQGGSEAAGAQQGGSEATEGATEPGEATTEPAEPKGPSAAQVKAAKAKVKGQSPKTVPPKKRPVKLLRQVFDAIETKQEAGEELEIDPQAVAMLRWVIGKATELDVEGLADLLENLEQ